MAKIGKPQFIGRFRYGQVAKQAGGLDHSHGLIVIMNALSKDLHEELL